MKLYRGTEKEFLDEFQKSSVIHEVLGRCGPT